MTNTDIAAAEEIDRRIAEADTARRAKRSTAAKQIGELARRRFELAEQLAEVEHHLGHILREASDVLDIAELATFTDIPASTLTEWLAARKPARSKKKPAGSAPKDTARAASTATTPPAPDPSSTPAPPTAAPGSTGPDHRPRATDT